jgi:hypothetical protein
MHSISDLMAFCRKTTGDIPAKLVVCSNTTTSPIMKMTSPLCILVLMMTSCLGRINDCGRLQNVSLCKWQHFMK